MSVAAVSIYLQCPPSLQDSPFVELSAVGDKWRPSTNISRTPLLLPSVTEIHVLPPPHSCHKQIILPPARRNKQRCKTPVADINNMRGASKKKSRDLRGEDGGNNPHGVCQDEGGAASILTALLKPTARRPRRTDHKYWHDHTRSAGLHLHGGDSDGFSSGCGSGERGSSVRLDYYGGIGRGGGGRTDDDTEDILCRVLASTRAVAREKEALVEVTCGRVVREGIPVLVVYVV